MSSFKYLTDFSFLTCRFRFPILYTLITLIFECKILKITMGLLLENLCYSGVSGFLCFLSMPWALWSWVMSFFFLSLGMPFLLSAQMWFLVMIKRLFLKFELSMILQRGQNRRWFVVQNELFIGCKWFLNDCLADLLILFLSCRGFFIGLQNLLLGWIHWRWKSDCLTNCSFPRLAIYFLWCVLQFFYYEDCEI